MDAAAALAAGRVTARELVERSLARIADPAGEGARTFVRVDAHGARAMADAMDVLRRAGRAPGPFAGIPVAIKDLADIAGEPTRAAAGPLADARPAHRTAAAVARLMGAGFVPVGRANMTEFAYSGLGLNPHFGTPACPWDRTTRRVPGGSSSGSAVAVADHMAFAALGTDTGGSCRIPAAFCGIVGFKPTARRVPLEGILPLSPSLDSVGPLARAVGDCAILDAVMAGGAAVAPPDHDAGVAGLRLGVPEGVVLDDADPAVVAAFDAALRRLEAAGIRLVPIPDGVFRGVAGLGGKGGIAAAEAHAWHRELLATRGEAYDPRIRSRILRGGEQSAAEYIDALATRRRLIADFDRLTDGIDAVAMPTVAVVPPPIAALEADDDLYLRTNVLVLRNTSLGNVLDRCAISLPIGSAPPVGLMLMGETLGDARLLRIAAAVERRLRA